MGSSRRILCSKQQADVTSYVQTKKLFKMELGFFITMLKQVHGEYFMIKLNTK